MIVARLAPIDSIDEGIKGAIFDETWQIKKEQRGKNERRREKRRPRGEPGKKLLLAGFSARTARSLRFAVK